jgi:hypothetical protein
LLLGGTETRNEEQIEQGENDGSLNGFTVVSV